jgi:Flp pilus assembly protein TadG
MRPLRLFRDEEGQTLIMVAIALPCLIAFIGLAVDVGALFTDRRQLQTAADSAAIAGALHLTDGNYVTAGKAASATNGYTDGSNNTTVNVVNGPTWPSSEYVGKANYVEATVTKVESTVFMAAFGFPSITVQARAVATNQAPGNGCVYLLGNDPTTPALTVKGNITITAKDCSWNIDDSYSNAITTTGNAYVVDTSEIGVASSTLNAKNLTDFTPQPVTGVVPFSDPLQSQAYPYTCSDSGSKQGCWCDTTNDPQNICGTAPSMTMPPSCSTPTLIHNGNTTLSPGCYDGFTIGSQDTVTLNPGVYFFNGTNPINFQAGGTMTITSPVTPVVGEPATMSSPTGVTLIFTGSTYITMNGNPNLTLEPPDSTGVFPNLLIYQVPSDTQTTYLGGTSGSTITGVIYVPGATESFQGTPGGNVYTDFVVKNLTLTGDASFNSYAALPGGAAALHAISLVE